MKLSRRLRSYGAAIVCFAMILCNVPHVRAGDVIIPPDVASGDVYGNGVAPDFDAPVNPPVGNSVTVTTGGGVTGTVTGNVYGGYADGGSAGANEVTISNGGTVTGNVYGGYANDGSAAVNEVTISNGGAVTGSIYGGYADGGSADFNYVTINNGGAVAGTKDIPAFIIGGYATAGGYVSGNEVRIESLGDTFNLAPNVNITGHVMGGRSDSGAVTGNTVNINANQFGRVSITGSVYGMYTMGADAQNNVLVLGTGSSVDAAYAGYSRSGNATDNWIILGGYANDTPNPDATFNSVNLSGRVSVANAYGGYTESGEARHNLISIQSDQNGTFYAGFTEEGEAYQNHVVIYGLNLGNLHAGHSEKNEAHNNTITIVDGNIKNLYGGSTNDGTARNNDISIAAGVVTGSIYGGHASGRGEVRENTVIIAGVSSNAPSGSVSPNPAINAVVHDVYGGYSEAGRAIDNMVTVNYYSRVSGNVVGGYSGRVTANESTGTTQTNNVTINDGAIITGNVYGGQSGSARANTVYIDGSVVNGEIVGGGDNVIGDYTRDNIVEIRNNASVGNVYGGKINSGKAVENKVFINGRSTGSNVYGGYTNTGYVEGNEVTINNGTFADVYGGRTTDGRANDNRVILNNGNIGSVYGGVTANNGHANDNTVVINGSTITGNNVIGGRNGSGNAINNAVTIVNSQLRNGGANIIGGDTSTGNADNNIVDIDGGEVNAGQIIGGNSAHGSADRNEVIIGNTSGNFVASELTGGSSSNGSADRNTVIIGRGNFVSVYGGRSGGSGDANKNSVTIHNGVFKNVYGGWSGGYGNADDNTVYLNGGTFSGEIYGGYSTSGSARRNTVDISAAAILTADVKLYGGYTGMPSRQDARSGNTLNIRKPVTITGIDNFENYNFILPANLTAGRTMITVTNGNGNNGAINLRDAKIEIGVSEGSSLKLGDTVILIDEKGKLGFNGNPTCASRCDGSTLIERSGLMVYNFDLKVENNQLLASLLGASLNEKTDSLPQGLASGMILANLGADAIAGTAMDSAMSAVHSSPSKRIGGFGSLVGGKSKYETGLNVEIIGVSAAAGLAIGFDFTSSSLTMGPFLEYGKGDYDTVYNLKNDEQIGGNGDSEYMGGGFLLRMDYKDTGFGRYFAEVSARAGRLKNNFSVAWTEEATEEETDAVSAVSYEASAPYYGFHLGYGGSWDVASGTALEIYGKYFFARGTSGTANLSGGEKFDFADLTSNRIRGGGRIAITPDEQLTLRFGGAYEYEMSGESKATMLGYAINAPSLKGGTGIGEVVVGYRFSSYSQMSINIGVQGYAGKRQGVNGSLYFRF